MTAETNTTRGACPASARRRSELIADIAALSAAHLVFMRRGFVDGVSDLEGAAETLNREVDDLDGRGMVGHEPDWTQFRQDAVLTGRATIPCRYCGSFGHVDLTNIEIDW